MLDQLYVFIFLNHEWIPCGLLKYSEIGRISSSSFRYGRKYLQRQDAIAIDPVQLPLIDVSIETPDGFQIFNGIRDAAPDKWGRYLLEKKFARALTEIEYIAASSTDRVGALAFAKTLKEGIGVYEPDGKFDIKTERADRLNLEECLGAIDDAINSNETERLRQYLNYGPSLGGARPKASVMWKNRPFLAKFSISLDTKNEPLIEYATMRLAKKCSLNVPEIELQTIDGRSVYLIARFDRKERSRIPFVSGLTLTGIHESDFSSWSYFSLIDAIIKFSSNSNRDLEELFKRLVFNIAVYNNDDHLRNFGFLYADNHCWDLSPLYDVVPSLTHTETYALAMALGVEGKKASYSNAMSMCHKFRLSPQQALAIIDNIKEQVAHWEQSFQELGLNAGEIKMLENSFKMKE